MATKINKNYISDFNSLYQDFLNSTDTPDIESFKVFLETSGFSTSHAEELFSYFHLNTPLNFHNQENSFASYYLHPKLTF